MPKLIKVSDAVYEKLKKIRDEYGFSGLSDVVAFLIGVYEFTSKHTTGIPLVNQQYTSGIPDAVNQPVAQRYTADSTPSAEDPITDEVVNAVREALAPLSKLDSVLENAEKALKLVQSVALLAKEASEKIDKLAEMLKPREEEKKVAEEAQKTAVQPVLRWATIRDPAKYVAAIESRTGRKVVYVEKEREKDRVRICYAFEDEVRKVVEELNRAGVTLKDLEKNPAAKELHDCGLIYFDGEWKVS